MECASNSWLILNQFLYHCFSNAMMPYYLLILLTLELKDPRGAVLSSPKFLFLQISWGRKRNDLKRQFLQLVTEAERLFKLLLSVFCFSIREDDCENWHRLFLTLWIYDLVNILFSVVHDLIVHLLKSDSQTVLRGKLEFSTLSDIWHSVPSLQSGTHTYSVLVILN